MRYGIFPAKSLTTLAALVLSTLVSCGGSGNGGAGTDAFLTADTQGVGAPAGLSTPGTGGAASETDHAAAAAGALAQEIEEADLYRVDGNRLFLLNAHRGLVLVDLASRSVLGRVPLAGLPLELHVRGDRAYVLIATFQGGGALLDVALPGGGAPVALARLPISGVPRTSRAIGERLFVVSDLAGTSSRVDSFGLGPVTSALGSLEVPLPARYVHASANLLFIASSDHESASTSVRIVDITSPTGLPSLRGSLTVQGTISADDRLHFGAGTFRIVTRTATTQAVSRLHVVNCANPDAPFVTGLLDLGYGEVPFASRFEEEWMYLVTFEQIDPLHVVDLSIPSNPVLVGELIVPGWSTQLVTVPGQRLVSIGMDPSGGWHMAVSLFDVSNPAVPTLAARVHLPEVTFSSALSDRKAFGVFPEAGVVLVPCHTDGPRLLVLDLAANTLTTRGWIDTGDASVRGFPATAGLCALTESAVVVANPANLASTERITVAENVLDVARVGPVGATSNPVVELTQVGSHAKVGSVDLPLQGDRLHRHGSFVAVTGWDDAGRAAYVIDFSGPTPSVSPRIDLGFAPVVPFIGNAYDVAIWQGGRAGFDTAVTPAGRLVVRAMTSATPDLVIGQGTANDGYVVIDLPTMSAESHIEIRGATTTGIATDGEALGLTLGRGSGLDEEGRPLLLHHLIRVDLASLAFTAETNVPGGLLALDGDLAFTAEEIWGDGWSVQKSVVASRITGARAEVLDRERLPAWTFDLRVGGSTLFYTEGLGPVVAALAGTPAAFWVPDTRIRTVRLGADLTAGPTIDLGESFATLLFVEEGAVLTMVNGAVLQRHDVSGPAAVLDWSRDIGTFPRTARADDQAGDYLLALGYGGWVRVP